MNDIQFENQGEEYGPPPKRFAGFDMTALLLKWRVVSSRHNAEYVLMGVALVAVVLALFFFFHAVSAPSQPPPGQIIQVAGPGAGAL